MSTQYLLIQCPALLIQAKRIFGEDIATNAWFAETYYEPESLNFNYVKEKLEHLVDSYGDSGEDIVSLDEAPYLVIEFCQNRKVFFSTSEWGHMELADEETVCYS